MKTQITDTLAVNISLAQVAAELHAQGQYLKDNFSKEDLTEHGSDFSGTDVRLQVSEDGGWTLHFGSSDYDQDHRGFWASSSVARACTWQEARETARELISSVE